MHITVQTVEIKDLVPKYSPFQFSFQPLQFFILSIQGLQKTPHRCKLV
jgi:hypothetical protein